MQRRRRADRTAPLGLRRLRVIRRQPAQRRLHVVVRELVHRVGEVSEHTRGRLERLGEIDLASQDVLIEVVRALEEQQWMLRAQLGAKA